METFFDSQTTELIIRLFWAMVFGMIIGTERLLARKTAGMRTYALISMGSALFVLISVVVSNAYIGISNFDPLRMAAQIIAGAGFLGAGLVIFKNNEVTGITSSAGLWVSAAIGMAAGFGLLKLAFVSTILTLFIFIVLWFIEEQLRKIQSIQKKIPETEENHLN